MRSLGKSFASFLVVVFIMSLIILQPTLVSAQTSSSTSPPATQWQKTYGSGETYFLSNLIQTSDGGYAFLDCGNFYQTTFTPATLFKLDSSGNEQWNKTINYFEAYIKGSSIIQTSDGGYEITGEWNTGTPTIIKLNSKGDIQWYENTSTVLNLAIASSNIQTSDGGFAYFEAGKAGDYPPFVAVSPTLVKTDSNNNTQWIENLTYSGSYSYENGEAITFPFKISSIIETSDGALAGLGIANPALSPQGWGYIYLLKTAPFLPLPSQSPLPTPLPSPTPAPIMITVNEQIVIIALIAVVIALSIVLLIYRRHRKTTKLTQ